MRHIVVLVFNIVVIEEEECSYNKLIIGKLAPLLCLPGAPSIAGPASADLNHDSAFSPVQFSAEVMRIARRRMFRCRWTS